MAGLFQAAGEGNLLLDAKGRIVFAGGVAHWFMGVAREEVVGRSFIELVPNDQQVFVAGAIERVRSGAAEPPFETHWTDSSTGRLVVIALQVAALVEEGRLLGTTVKGFELSTRQAADAAARGDVAVTRQLSERSPFMVFQLDARGQCTSVNARWSLFTGQQRGHALGTGWLNHIPEAQRAAFRAMAAAAHKERRGWRHQFPIGAANGETSVVDGAAMLLVDDQGTTVGYFGVLALVSTSIDHASTAPAPATSTSETVAGETGAPAGGASAGSTQESTPSTSTSTPPGTRAPVGPAPVAKHALPSPNSTGPWSPKVPDGFTDPELLIADRGALRAPLPESPVTEPAIDKVTGLANRLLFAQHVEATVSRIQSDALTVSLSFVDMHGLDEHRLENPRNANDFLFLLAKRLESTIRSIEIAGRIDGDVLGVLSINWLFADDLPIVASRLLGRLGEPLAAKDGTEVNIDMRLGMAVARQDDKAEELFRRAWDAMEAAADSPDHYVIDLGTPA